MKISGYLFFSGILYGLAHSGIKTFHHDDRFNEALETVYKNLTEEEKEDCRFWIIPDRGYTENFDQWMYHARHWGSVTLWTDGENVISDHVKNLENLPFTEQRCKELGQIVIDSFEPRN